MGNYLKFVDFNYILFLFEMVIKYVNFFINFIFNLY